MRDKRIWYTAVAALLMALFIPLPAAHGVPFRESVYISTVRYTATPLSTKTAPSIIRSKTYKAWKNREFRWSSDTQWRCFDNIIKKESAWSPWSTNGMGWEETGGIPQAHPSRKMASAGRDYRTNAWTQIRWGVRYIHDVYGTPCNAWDRWQSRAANGRYGWY